MGGTSKTETTQQSQTSPWAPAQPLLNGILVQLQGGMGNTGLTGAETAEAQKPITRYASRRQNRIAPS